MRKGHTPTPWKWEAATNTLRSVPANYWIASVDSWDGMVNNEEDGKFIIQAVNSHAALVDACKALHDALSNILEDCAAADREGEIDHVHGNEYEIGRDHKAQGKWAIRKSFKALAKIPGGME